MGHLLPNDLGGLLSRAGRPVVALCLSLALGWLVLRGPFVSYLSAPYPLLAARLAPSHPRVLQSLANERIRTGSMNESTTADLAHLARMRLATEPGNTDALRTLAFISIAKGEMNEATRLLTHVTTLTLRDPAALYWVMMHHIARDDPAAVLPLADALLRITPDAVDRVAPALAHAITNTNAEARLAQMLATNPPWRPAFLRLLGERPKSVDTLIALLRQLRSTDFPPTEREINTAIDALLRNHQASRAYTTWLETRTGDELAAVALLTNGQFERDPKGGAFDWRMASSPGVVVGVTRQSQGADGRALRLRFSGARGARSEVSQTLVLAPGRYQFTGKYLGKLPTSVRLSWKIFCLAPPGHDLAESETVVATDKDWRSLAMTFRVPQSGCNAQRLFLATGDASPGNGFASGELWFDEFAVQRLQPHRQASTAPEASEHGIP